MASSKAEHSLTFGARVADAVLQKFNSRRSTVSSMVIGLIARIADERIDHYTNFGTIFNSEKERERHIVSWEHVSRRTQQAN